MDIKRDNNSQNNDIQKSNLATPPSNDVDKNIQFIKDQIIEMATKNFRAPLTLTIKSSLLLAVDAGWDNGGDITTDKYIEFLTFINKSRKVHPSVTIKFNLDTPNDFYGGIENDIDKDSFAEFLDCSDSTWNYSTYMFISLSAA